MKAEGVYSALSELSVIYQNDPATSHCRHQSDSMFHKVFQQYVVGTIGCVMCHECVSMVFCTAVAFNKSINALSKTFFHLSP